MSDDNDYKPTFSPQDAEYFNRRLRKELERAGHTKHVINEGTPEDKAKLAKQSGDFSELRKSMPIRNEYLRLFGIREFERQNAQFTRAQSEKRAAEERERKLAETRQRLGIR